MDNEGIARRIALGGSMRLTYDLTTEQVARLRQARAVVDAVLAGNTNLADLEAMAAGLEETEDIRPICAQDERLVVTAQAFRDFHDGALPEDAELIASAPDSLIEEYVNLDAVYTRGWADVCEDTLVELESRARNSPGDFNRTEDA